MPTALTFAFDATTRQRIEALWARLDAAGIGDPSLRAGHPPHLTLAVVDGEVTEVDVAPSVPLLTLTHLGFFPAPAPVLFLAPTVTFELLEAQALAVTGLCGSPLQPHFAPGDWVPHVTLAQGFADASRAMAALGPVDLPMEAIVEAVELVAFPPARVVARYAAR